MQAVDTLIHSRWLVPVVPTGVVLEHHAIAVRDGRIVDILPSIEARASYHAEHEHELVEHLLIPGLINAHTHAAMSLMRGLADDLPLMSWLNDHIWPAEGQHVGPEFVREGSRLAMAEMLRSGTTCFNEMYFFPDVVAQEVERTGMRAQVGLILIDFPTAWAQDADEYLKKGIAVHDTIRQMPLVSSAFAPHAPYTCSDEPLRKLAMYAEELDLPIHMHVHETEDEVNGSLEQYGKRPLARLDELGLLGPRLTAVHMTQLSEAEIARVAEAGAQVVHCPESNMKLASGHCPVEKLRAAGVSLALGTDGAASNNDLDMLGEMRSAALLAKSVSGEATALPAAAALEAATLGGARALGLDSRIGSLEVGKEADITALRLDELESLPLYNPISQLVYASDRRQVSDVWVAGRHLLKGRRLTTLNEDELRESALRWQGRLRGEE